MSQISEAIEIRKTSLDTLEQLDHHEDLIYEVAKSFFTRHDLLEELYRLEEGRVVGVSKHRFFIKLCKERMGGSWEEMVSFYESCNRKGEEPHYEDLFTSVIIATIATIVAECFKTVLNRVIDDKEKKNHIKNITIYYFNTTNYITLGTILRDEHRYGMTTHDGKYSISDEEYAKLLEALRKDLRTNARSSENKDEIASELLEKFKEYVKVYSKNHRFKTDDPAKEIFDELIQEVESRLERKRGE